jgi:hypothetical protein
MQYCRDDDQIKDLIAYAMANNSNTNPEGLPVEVFKEKLSTVPVTNELMAQWLNEDVVIPEY